MNYGIYIALKDFIITAFETVCLLILVSNEEEKYRFGKYIFAVALTLSPIICTHLGFPVYVKMGITEGMIILIGGRIYKSSKIRLGIYGGIYLLVLLGCELVVVQGWNLFNEPIFSTNILQEDFDWTVVILAKSLLFIILVALTKIIDNVQKIKKITDGLPIIILSFPFLIVMCCLYVLMPQIQDKRYRMLFLVCDVCVFGAFISTIIFTQYYINSQQQKREEDVALYELKVKNDYYLKKLNAQNEIKQIYHDLKNHFLIAENSADNKNYLDKIEFFESYYETGNDFLDIILADKINKAIKFGIRMECEVDFSKGSFMEPLDISTVFGNILDNAIEACQKVDEEEKNIFFKCIARNNLLSVVVKNSMVGYDREIKTTKKNKVFHGYGLQNVNKVIRYYDGEMFIESDGNEFILSIIIPIIEEKCEV